MRLFADENIEAEVDAILIRGGHNAYEWIANAIHETLIGRKLGKPASP